MAHGSDYLVSLEAQLETYRAWRGHYYILTELLRWIIEQALKDRGIAAIVEGRVKTDPSFIEKALRRRSDYRDPINEFPDLAGIRIITQFKNDIPAVQTFIEQYFQIDDAGIEDMFTRHGTREFGYGGTHFTVTLKQENFKITAKKLRAGELIRIIKGSGLKELENRLPSLDNKQSDNYSDNFNAVKRWLLKHLCEQKMEGTRKANHTHIKPKMRAEIQVHTLLQHVWAKFAHDRLYKIRVPDYLERNAHRIAATLEEADEDIVRAIEKLDEYRTCRNDYISPEDRERELKIFLLVHQYDEDNIALAHKVASIALSLRKWELAEQTLARLVRKWEQSKDAKILKRRFHSLFSPSTTYTSKHIQHLRESLSNPNLSDALTDYGWAKWRRGLRRGRYYLQWAIGLNPKNIDAHVFLGKVFIEVNEVEKALLWFERAFILAPTEPRVLAGLLECRIIVDGNLSCVPMARASLEAAMKSCYERAEVGTFLPEAFYDISLFAWLLGVTYEGFTALTKAIHCSYTHSHVKESLDRTVKIRKALMQKDAQQIFPMEEIKERYAAIELLEKLLELAQYAKKPRSPKTSAKPAVLIIDRSAESLSNKIYTFRQLIASSFSRYEGALWYNSRQVQVERLSENLIAGKGSTASRENPQHTHGSPASDFSNNLTRHELDVILGNIQCWLNVIDQGIHPKDVKLLVIDGNRLVRFECMLALSLGAKVGVIAESGGAASGILRDRFWKDCPKLIRLPYDIETLRHFVCSLPPTVMLAQHREDMAREQHERYRDQKFKDRAKHEPNLKPWKDLPEILKESNRRQIDHIEMKLRTIGLQLRYVGHSNFETEMFKDHELEFLAEMEHGRWNADYLLGGWRLGTKDLQNRKSPYLVPWTRLPNETKQYDRLAVMSIPELLRKWGYKIIRSDGSAKKQGAGKND